MSNRKNHGKPPVSHCVLCERNINILGSDYVIGISGKMICRGCLQTAFQVLDEPEPEKPQADVLLTPRSSIREPDKAIIGQERAKEAVALGGDSDDGLS